ncbi:MAG: hypothetical protein WKF96_17450 [Solirubrobacteraceae bacterium]
MSSGFAHGRSVIHDNFNDSVTGTNFCGSGLTVNGVVSGVQNITDDGTNFTATGRVSTVFTNPDSCKSVTLSSSGRFTSTLLAGTLGGVHTYLNTYKGLPAKVQTTHGGVLIRDAGVITFADTFDADDNLGSTTVVNEGPHPEADSDFTLFCDTVVPVLS